MSVPSATPRALLAYLAIVAIALAGCGGGSSEPTPAPNAPARAAFIKRVDEICARYATRVTRAAQHFEAVQHRAGASGAFAAAAGAYRAAATRVDRLVEAVRAVPAPVDGEAAIDAWLTATEREADDRRALADALDDPQPPAEATASQQAALRDDAAEARAAIAGFGFRTCGS